MKKLALFLSFLFVISCTKDPIIYTLTTSANPSDGGTVSPSTQQYEEGKTATITATASSEYLFQSWSGATGSTNSTSVVMNSDKSVTANFVKKQYPLTIEIEGEGTVSETVIKQGLATDYNSGTIVELTAEPTGDWEFVEWTGDITSTENPVQIIIDKPKTVKALFTIKGELSIDFNNSTGMMISKAKTNSTFGASNSDYNVKLINLQGELTDLVIPGSKSYNLNITKAIDLSDKYLMLFGNLNVEYFGDVNGDGETGDSINYNNIIIDKTTGDFYEAGQGFGGINRIEPRNPWENHMFQSDRNGNIYYDNQENLSSSNIQVVDKLNLVVNNDQISVNRVKLNVIAEKSQFMYLVGDNGDMLYTLEKNDFGRNRIGFRNSVGKTYILNEGDDDPFPYENQSSDEHIGGSFFIQGKDSKIYVFKLVRSDNGYDLKYALLHIYENDSQEIVKSLVKEFDYELNEWWTDQSGEQYKILNYIVPNSRMKGRYLRTMLFTTLNPENNITNHIIVNGQFGSNGILITKFQEGENHNDFKLDGLFTNIINESQFQTSIANESFCATENSVFYAFSQKVVKIDFSPLSVNYLIENSGYEFYKLAASSDSEFYFYGLSYENGKRTLGKFNTQGQIEIIEQFDNDIDVINLIRIGGNN